jgi:hypothetical protein
LEANMIVVADRRGSRVVESDGFAWLHVTIESDHEALGALLENMYWGELSAVGPRCSKVPVRQELARAGATLADWDERWLG